MPKATKPNGDLQRLDKAYLIIPNYGTIYFYNLPELGDSKNASYNTDGIIGRSSPIHTYSHSDTRQISVQFHFFVLTEDDIDYNLNSLRAIQSCVYPRQGEQGAPFKPPVVCRLKVGELLGDTDLCVVLQQYSVKFPTEVAWDEDTYLPYKFDIDTTWWTVYNSSALPYQSNIIESGR